jgi:hypothetical protein
MARASKLVVVRPEASFGASWAERYAEGLLSCMANHFETPAHLLSYLLEGGQFTVSTPVEAGLRGRNGWIFRGHSNSTWTLLPSAHRSGIAP